MEVSLFKTVERDSSVSHKATSTLPSSSEPAGILNRTGAQLTMSARVSSSDRDMCITSL